MSVTNQYPKAEDEIIGAQNFPIWRGMNNHAWARIDQIGGGSVRASPSGPWVTQREVTLPL